MLAAVALLATLASNTDLVLQHYEANEAKHLVPMLQEVIRFPTDQYNPEAHEQQKKWLATAAADMGFVLRDAGKITEIELPGPEGAPVLGLIIHGDVQPADPDPWTYPPYDAHVEGGFVWGRGSVDDKGPLIQTLLAMKALKESGVPRTHTIRLLVGSEEESAATEMPEYLKTHTAPDYSLVLDSEFPVVVGEKAWDGLALVASKEPRGGKSTKPYTVELLTAGLSPSIVPDRAEVQLHWTKGTPDWTALTGQLRAFPMPEGTRLVISGDGDLLRVIAYGVSAHAGVNLTGGRNALVGLARAVEGKLPPGGPDDLLAFVRMAGQDLYGTGLGIKDNDPIWGRYAVNIATIKPTEDEKGNVLYINLRRIPPRTAPQSKAFLTKVVSDFNRRTGAKLTIDEKLSYFEDEPLGFDPEAKIVRRLMEIYTRATGESAKPAISGGGTYAKRIPNAIAFGMWFPGKPYPGHDANEKISIDDLQRGAKVLIHALTDIATGPKMLEPLKR